MKKFLCIVIMLLMVLMISVPAFAMDDPVTTEATVDGAATTATVVTETASASPLLTIIYIMVFSVCVAVLAWLALRGKLKAAGLQIISTMTSAVTAITTSIAAITPNKTDDIVAVVMQLIEKAVYAAENMYYNEQITAEERYTTCIQYFNEMLETANITLTDAWQKTIDVLIKAACESMGHTVALEEAVMVGDNTASGDATAIDEAL